MTIEQDEVLNITEYCTSTFSLQVFDFELSEDDMKAVEAINMPYRALHLKW